jgi:hypothetical protein
LPQQIPRECGAGCRDFIARHQRADGAGRHLRTSRASIREVLVQDLERLRVMCFATSACKSMSTVDTSLDVSVAWSSRRVSSASLSSSRCRLRFEMRSRLVQLRHEECCRSGDECVKGTDVCGLERLEAVTRATAGATD